MGSDLWLQGYAHGTHLCASNIIKADAAGTSGAYLEDLSGVSRWCCFKPHIYWPPRRVYMYTMVP